MNSQQKVYRESLQGLIVSGDSLREMAKEIGCSHHAIENGLERYSLYEDWKVYKELRKDRDERMKYLRVEVNKNLAYLFRQNLEQRMLSASENEVWAVKKTMEYRESLIKKQSNNVAHTKLYEIFYRYRTAVYSGEKLSLADLGEGLNLSDMNVKIILNRVGLVAMLNRGNRKISR